jgi:hypothetical protein
MSDNSKIKKLRISPELLIDFFRGMNGQPRRMTCEGLPGDAQVVATGGDSHSLILYVQSETFEQVSGDVPTLTLIFRDLDQLPAAGDTPG